MLSLRVLHERERTLGSDAPETAIALVTLGDVLVKKGELAAAEPLLRRALAAQEQCLAADNPEAGLTMWHLAETLRGLGRLGEAERLARRALEIWEGQFGPDHEWTAWALISLSKVRLARGDATEAARLAGRAAQNPGARVRPRTHRGGLDTETAVERADGIEEALVGAQLKAAPRRTSACIKDHWLFRVELRRIVDQAVFSQRTKPLAR